jgi:hypothetical protein
MTPSGFEPDAVVSRRVACEALRGAGDGEAEAHELVEGPCSAWRGLTDARTRVRAPGVHSRGVDVSADVAPPSIRPKSTREPEAARAGFGDVFPALPDGLLGGGTGSFATVLQNCETSSQVEPKTSRFKYRRRDSNPHALSDGGF